MSSMIIKKEFLKVIIRKEVKSLFTKEAHDKFDFDNFDFVDEDGLPVYPILEIKLKINKENLK